MVTIIDGDLFNTNAKFIAHQVNCMGKMDSGVALQVKNKYPHVYEEYQKIASSNMLGQIQLVPCNSKYIGMDSGSLAVPYQEQYICNMFAQNNYGYNGKQYTSLCDLKKCFLSLCWITMEKNANFGAKIAMPYKIGCCRGGADWKDVYSMIEEIFKDTDVELWRFDKG